MYIDRMILASKKFECFASDHAHKRDNWQLARSGEGQSARSRWWAVS